ncbi:MAG: sulfurtransferase [Alphaproteobacteria bacterium]|nr:MAG: sulfurtransferase [Alphaproteobacteria bacterium]
MRHYCRIRRSRLGALSLIIALGVAIAIQATAAAGAGVSPLVDADWVARNAGRPGIVILDIRNRLGGGSADAYRAGHIPGAVYSDYLKAGWRTTVDGVPGQLPPAADLERLIGGLGIDNDSHVVIVAGGQSALDMGSATRVYWTFKVLGHDKVSILDGGYRAYVADPARPVETGWNQPTAKVFQARLRPEMIADYHDVLAAQQAGAALIDMRPPSQYRGEKRHPAAKRAGTIPGAVNVPESQITFDGGRFVDAARVAELLRNVGVTTDQDAVAFCNTGHWASLGWFVQSEILGNKKVKLYDGSMVDWSAREELPVVRP